MFAALTMPTAIVWAVVIISFIAIPTLTHGLQRNNSKVVNELAADQRQLIDAVQRLSDQVAELDRVLKSVE